MKERSKVDRVQLTNIIIESLAAERVGVIPDILSQHRDLVSSMWTTDPHLIITTPDGEVRANVGDWIVVSKNKLNLTVK